MQPGKHTKQRFDFFEEAMCILAFAWQKVDAED